MAADSPDRWLGDADPTQMSCSGALGGDRLFFSGMILADCYSP